jgi:predicted methyltransferase
VSGSPLLTREACEALARARTLGTSTLACSLDLGRSIDVVEVDAEGWGWRGRRFPHPAACRERTIYAWDGREFVPVQRYGTALVKLVPTEWGAPTFEIDGVKMLPTAQVSPWDDARAKVEWVEPRGRVVLDTCGGLGYFAAQCLLGGAARVQSYEKNPDVTWLRRLNPWSPEGPGSTLPLDRLVLTPGDVAEAIAALPDAHFDAALHDPPRFALAGELYSQAFYDQLARVLKPRARLFHYTGTPNRVSRGRDLPAEVAVRLERAGLDAAPHGDGVRAVRRGGGARRRARGPGWQGAARGRRNRSRDGSGES